MAMVRELPVDERPRERLLALGPGFLSNAELLAIVLRNGSKERSALQLAQDILSLYKDDGVSALGRITAGELMCLQGIGSAKAAEIHVIAAGSRLQSLTREGLSFPVGRVEYLTLRPFSFAEYIEAKRGEAWADMVRGLSVPEMLHEDMIAEFNTYALVGGMPEAVAEYLDAGDITRLAPIFNALLKGYNEDAEKFAKNQEQAKILRHILSTAWLSAAETITFGCFGNSSYTATQIHDAMDLLERAYLLSLDYPVTATAVPAMPAKRRAPKLMMVDTGLANFFAGIQVQYLQNKELLDTWRGRAAEHIVAQELRIAADRQYKESLYFWVRDQKGATAEVDFIWQDGIQIIPIEVKAGTNARLRSLHSFVNACDRPVVALRVWSGNYSVQEVTTPAPHAKPFSCQALQ